MAKVRTHWTKTTPYGDYSQTPDRVNSRTNSQTMILREARKLGVVGRHGGSKPLYKILNGLAKAHEAISSSKEN